MYHYMPEKHILDQVRVPVPDCDDTYFELRKKLRQAMDHYQEELRKYEKAKRDVGGAFPTGVNFVAELGCTHAKARFYYYASALYIYETERANKPKREIRRTKKKETC